MSVTDRTGVTPEAVKEELAELEATYKTNRAAVLANLAKPYCKRRKTLRALLAVLEPEEEEEDELDDDPFDTAGMEARAAEGEVPVD